MSKHYNEEFRLQASKLVVESGYSYKEAGKRLGVSDWSIRQWVIKFRNNRHLPPEGTPCPEVEELKRLRKENARLELENEILKKATAYFARDLL